MAQIQERLAAREKKQDVFLTGEGERRGKRRILEDQPKPTWSPVRKEGTTSTNNSDEAGGKIWVRGGPKKKKGKGGTANG